MARECEWAPGLTFRGKDKTQFLLIDGVWKGVQAILVFLPQILLLFLFIGISKIRAIWRARP